MASSPASRRCIVVTRFAHDQPGYLDFAYRVEALAKHYRVTLISDHPLTVPEMQIDGVEHIVLPSDGRSILDWLRYLWQASRHINRVRPDFVLLLHTMTAPIVYLIQGTPHALYWNEHAVRVLGNGDKGWITTAYRQWKYRFLFIEPTKRADIVMPIGEAHRDDLLDQGCKPEKLRMVYMGVDERFSAVALQRKRTDADEALALIYTGTVQKERGRDVMLEAVAKATRMGIPVTLTLVGAQPDEMTYCHAYAKQLGIEGNILIHGRVPGSEIPHFIAQADAGICLWEDRPWWRFNPPTKLFEYLVAGLPVLASNIRTHTQYVRHGENGFVFEYEADSLARGIDLLWEHRRQLNAMKQRAHDSGRPYLWANIEPVFLELVSHLAARTQ